jgi:glycerophosphoryl diester phosphodiesterase
MPRRMRRTVTGFFEPPTPRLIAHRGASGTRPENTLAAFESAAAAGAEMIELDLHLSADGVPVVIHDSTLGRTTGSRGPVARRTARELAALDAGFRFSSDGGRSHPFRGAGVGIPALADVLVALPRIRFILEVKTADPALDDALLAVLRRTRAERRVLVAGQEGPVVRRLRSRFAGIPTNFARDEVAAFLRDGAADVAPDTRALQVPPRYRGLRIVTRRFVERAHAAGIEVHVWTVNGTAAMHALLDLGVDGIITDFPERLLRVCRERGLR